MTERSATISYEEKHDQYDKFFDPIQYLSYYVYGDSWGIPNSQLDEKKQAFRFKLRTIKSFSDWALQSKDKPVRVLDLSTGPYIG